MDANIPNRQLTFGLRIPPEFVDGFTGKNFDPNKVNLKFFIDLLISRFPNLKEASHPLNVDFAKDDGSFLSIDLNNSIRYSELLKSDDPTEEVVLDGIWGLIENIADKLNLLSINEFAFNQCYVVPKVKYLEDDSNLFVKYLKDNKIYSNKDEHFLSSRTVRFKRGNKDCYLRMEPFLSDRDFYFLEYDVKFNITLPIKDIKQLFNQEIKHFATMKLNLSQ